MLSNEYLYGKDIEFPPIPEEIIVRRIEALNENLEKVMSEHYLARDVVRAGKIQKAIKFWKDVNNV